MKTYTCTVHETHAFSITVEADSMGEAMDLAEAAHQEGKSVFNSLVSCGECVSATEESE